MASAQEQLSSDQAKLNGVKQALDTAQGVLQARTAELDEREKDVAAKDKKVWWRKARESEVQGIMSMLFVVLCS